MVLPSELQVLEAVQVVSGRPLAKGEEPQFVNLLVCQLHPFGVDGQLVLGRGHDGRPDDPREKQPQPKSGPCLRRFVDACLQDPSDGGEGTAACFEDEDGCTVRVIYVQGLPACTQLVGYLIALRYSWAFQPSALQ